MNEYEKRMITIFDEKWLINRYGMLLQTINRISSLPVTDHQRVLRYTTLRSSEKFKV